MSSSSSFEEEKKTSSLNSKNIIVSILFRLALVIFFILYIYSLFFGESSINVLQSAKDRYERLNLEYNKIQNENQKLQKKHFELIQLTPEDNSF